MTAREFDQLQNEIAESESREMKKPFIVEGHGGIHPDETPIYVERWAAGRMDLTDDQIAGLADAANAHEDGIADFLNMLDTLDAEDVLYIADHGVMTSDDPDEERSNGPKRG